MKKGAAVFFSTLFLWGTLCAAHPFRVDLRDITCLAGEPDPAQITGKGIRVGRIGENGLWIEGEEPLRADRWNRITFTFTPTKEGTFDLLLRGPWRKQKGAKEIERLEVLYDQLELSGAALQNGDFESASAAGPALPEGWRSVGKGTARVENAVSGKFGVKVWHDGYFAQKLHVKANVPVTLSFSVRREPDEAEKPVSAGAIPLTGWSGETSLQPVPKAGVEALLPGKGKLFCSRQILVKPSTRYQLSFRYYSERSNLFYLELEEYDRTGRPLPRTDWMRHRDTFLRPDLSLRKTELQMELPFDTQPECASLRIEIRKLSAAKVWFWDFQLKEEKPRRLLEPELFQPGDSLSMRGPDGIFYPDFTRAGVSERRPPKTVFAARDFGALPGDDRDDAAGIQKAVDAAAKNGEGIVQLEAGEYWLDGKVYITADRIVIRGAGRGKTRLVSRPRPSGLQIMNFAPGNRIGGNTRLELYFPWKKCTAVSLLFDGKELGRWEIPAAAEAEKFDSTEAYLKSVGFRKDRGFSVSQADPAVGRIVLQPREYLSKLAAGPCRLTLKTTGYQGEAVQETFNFQVTPAQGYTKDHSLLHFEGNEFTATASRMPLAADMKRGEVEVELASDHRLTPECEYIFLNAPVNTEWDRLAHTPLAWGKMRRNAFRILRREGKKLTLADPSRVPFFAAEGAFATAFFPIRFCAAEGFTIEQQGKIQRDFQLNAISFQAAADCEARNLEVIKAGVWPVRFSYVIHCAFTDSVLRGAHFPRSLLSYAGFEYGTHCLMERIETFDLRHAPLLNWCCSGCVIRDSVFHNSDAQFHSGYCLENLIEQCRIIETTGKFSSYGFAFYSTPFNDGMHGSCGPRNVIYNCDARSRRSSIYLGGNNFQWRIVYNRFLADSGPGIIARLNCRDNIIRGNVFTLKDAAWPLLFNEYLENSGCEFVDNTILGGNGKLLGGVAAEFQQSGNCFLPVNDTAPSPSAPVPSLYLWQKEQKAGLVAR